MAFQDEARSEAGVDRSTANVVARTVEAFRTRRPDLFLACVVAPIPLFFLERELTREGSALGYVPMRSLTYLFVCAAVVAHATSVAIGGRRAELPAWLSAPLTVSAAAACVLGVLLLPATMFGTLFTPWALAGFTPLAAAFGYRRQARSAFALACAALDRRTVHERMLASTVVFGALLFGAWRLERHVEIRLEAAVMGEDTEAAQSAERTLYWLHHAAQLPLSELYMTPDPSTERGQRAWGAWFRITGRSPNTD